jgi:hypothetical protein
VTGFSYEELSQVFSYNPETGVMLRHANFLRQKRNASGEKVCAGKIRYGHLRLSHKGKQLLVHRVAFLLMTRRWPTGVVDHINGKTDDNRWVNLRECTKAENTRHQKVSKRSSSGYRGVHFVKGQNRWRAVIGVGWKSIYLGQFENIEDAVAARQAASIRFHGAFSGQLTRDGEL